MQPFLAKLILGERIEGKKYTICSPILSNMHEQVLAKVLFKISLWYIKSSMGEKKVYCFRDISILEFRVHRQICES